MNLFAILISLVLNISYINLLGRDILSFLYIPEILNNSEWYSFILCCSYAVALRLLKHPRITCCYADGRTSYPGKPSCTDKQIGQSRRPPVRIKDDLGSEVCRRCHCVDIGYRPRRLEIVECPLRRTTRSECVKNTLIGRETEHRQSSWIKRSCLISICPPATRKTKKASLICGTRWYTLTKLLLTSAVGICQNPN